MDRKNQPILVLLSSEIEGGLRVFAQHAKGTHIAGCTLQDQAQGGGCLGMMQVPPETQSVVRFLASFILQLPGVSPEQEGLGAHGKPAKAPKLVSG